MVETIAVLIPCYNEAKTITKVVQDFKRELPEAIVCVFDNNSTDGTAKLAKEAGAEVCEERRQGKGNVVRSMFQRIDADVYVLVDGDDTYPAEEVKHLIRPILNHHADMVVGDRLSNGTYQDANKRLFHGMGNHLVKVLINRLFEANLHDIMSGYRVMNRAFVKNIPIASEGFEVETEMTIQALDKRFVIQEIPIVYRDRPEGSFSKLHTVKDGIKVLRMIVMLLKDYRPLMFFSLIFALFFALSLLVGIPVLVEYFQTAYVSKVPSAVLAVGLMLISILSLFSGFLLDTIAKRQKEMYELNLLRWFEYQSKGKSST